MNRQLAVIKGATLHLHNNTCLTFYLDTEYESGGSQQVGHLVLDTVDSNQQRIGTAYGCDMIRQLLLFFGVNDLSKVKNHICYVFGDGEGLSFKPKGLENIAISTNSHRQKVLDFDAVLSKFQE